MSDRLNQVLIGTRARDLAIAAIRRAPDGYVCEVYAPRRTTEQNKRMWAMLNDVAVQVQWHGQWLSAENWKDMVSAAVKRQQVVPGIDGGFVVLGARTSRMTIREMQEIIDFIDFFGAQHNVVFRDPRAETPVPSNSAGETPGASVSR